VSLRRFAAALIQPLKLHLRWLLLLLLLLTPPPKSIPFAVQHFSLMFVFPLSFRFLGVDIF
jgi:hypothetical protein